MPRLAFLSLMTTNCLVGIAQSLLFHNNVVIKDFLPQLCRFSTQHYYCKSPALTQLISTSPPSRVYLGTPEISSSWKFIHVRGGRHCPPTLGHLRPGPYRRILLAEPLTLGRRLPIQLGQLPVNFFLGVNLRCADLPRHKLLLCRSYQHVLC